MGEQALTFYPIKFALVGVQRKEEIIMQSLFDENKRPETKRVPLVVYVLGVVATLGGLGTLAYYFWPF